MNKDTLSARDYMGLAGKTCVVTGASSGIGRATALALAQLGAHVVVLARDSQGVQDTTQHITAEGGRALAVTCDVSHQEEVIAAAHHVRQALGACDVLVNAAGVLRAASLEDVTLEQWNSVMETNLNGYLLCAQAFGAPMREQGHGAIVHIASIVTACPAPHAGAYSASKAAIAALSRQLALEWGPHGVRSNTICPGMTWTAMTQASYGRPGEADLRSSTIPLRRIGQPEDIANAAVFLASERSAYINGADLFIDGGFTRNNLGMVPTTAQ